MVLEQRGHADVAIGDHAGEAPLVVDDGDDAAVLFPHDLGGGLQRLIDAAGVDGLAHQVFDAHG